MLLLTYIEGFTFCEGMAYVILWAGAYGFMIDNFTLCVNTADSGTRIGTAETETSQVTGAFTMLNTFRVATAVGVTQKVLKLQLVIIIIAHIFHSYTLESKYLSILDIIYSP